MTPTKLDWRSLRAKLHKINELRADLHGLGAVDLRRLTEDRLVGLAVERVLTVIVDLAVSINSHVCAVELGYVADTYADSFPLAAKAGLIDKDLAERLQPSAGLRNVIIHEYIKIDYQRVADAIPMAIEQYGRYVEQVARWLLDRQKVSGGM
jgi:uncharacterized protein YutE (UPF0331/DUF86 family)